MLPGSPSIDADGLDNDQIWGEDNNVPSQEWTKLDNDFTNAGYREGITAGKESALQEGFDEGFATIGAPLGREIGILRGTANAAMGYLSSTIANVEVKPGVNDHLRKQAEEIRNIINDLSKLSFVDLAPRDLQAEAHAREHTEQKSSEEVTISVSTNTDGSSKENSSSYYQLSSLEEGQSKSIAATEELTRLRIRLAKWLQELDLTLPSL